MTKDEVICKSIANMRKQGVTAIKIELEGQMNRLNGNSRCQDCEQGEIECDYCDSAGDRECAQCDGSGRVDSSDDTQLESTEECELCEGRGEMSCDECDGTHYTTCPHCDGDYRQVADNFGVDTKCLDYILEHLATTTGSTIKNYAEGDEHDGEEVAVAFQPFDWLHYACFYNDHSVDSEMTFTVPIDKEENIKKLPEVIKAFVALSETIGNGLDVRGAGMHTAVLFSSDYSYPSSSGLSAEKLHNFKRSMTQLLPALYFLGTSNDKSRNMLYRRPEVNVDSSRYHWSNNPKYAAVVHREGSIEFRVFDTCYDNPEAILDNLVVISNCMKFLSKTYKNPNIGKIASNLKFGNDNSYDLDRLYMSVTHIDVLNAGLSVIKPSYYTITELKKQRGFKLNKRSLTNVQKVQTEKAVAGYKEYRDRFSWTIEAKIQDVKANRLREFASSNIEDIRGTTLAQKMEEITKNLENIKAGWEEELIPEASYVKDRLAAWRRNNEGAYTLTFVGEDS